MLGYLRQSTASQTRTIGPFVDDTDFKTLENGLTINASDVVLKKNGAASGTKNSGGATADGSGGLYHLTWDATDTSAVGELSFSVKVAGALVVFGTYVVLEEAVYDALFAASAEGYSTLDAAGIRTAVGLASANLDTQLTAIDDAIDTEVAAILAAVDTEVAAIKAVTDNLPDSGALTSLATAAALATVDGIVDAIVADTNELQTDWADGGRLDLILDARASQASVDTVDDFLDTEVAAILAAVDTEVAAIKTKTDQLTFTTANQVDATTVTNSDKTGYRLSATGVDDVHDEVVEGTTTLRQMMRGFAAALLGKASGLATTTAVYRDIGDTKDRITATVDADGNRTAVTRDLT